MLVIYDVLMKQDIIKAMDFEIINTRTELHRGNTEYKKLSRERIHVRNLSQ